MGTISCVLYVTSVTFVGRRKVSCLDIPPFVDPACRQRTQSFLPVCTAFFHQLFEHFWRNIFPEKEIELFDKLVIPAVERFHLLIISMNKVFLWVGRVKELQKKRKTVVFRKRISVKTAVFSVFMSVKRVDKKRRRQNLSAVGACRKRQGVVRYSYNINKELFDSFF